MSSLVCYDSFSSDEDNDQQHTSDADHEKLDILKPLQINLDDSVIEESSNSLIDNSNENNERQESTLCVNQEKFQNASTIINIEEESSNNINEGEKIDFVLDTNPSEPQIIMETYRESEIINISIDSEDDSTSLSSLTDSDTSSIDSDDDSSSSSSSSSTDIISENGVLVDDLNSNSENKVNNVKQKRSTEKLCNYCLNCKNNEGETVNDVSENQSSFSIPNVNEITKLKYADNKNLSTGSDNNMDIIDGNTEGNQNEKEKIHDNQNKEYCDTNLDTIDGNKEGNQNEKEIIHDNQNKEYFDNNMDTIDGNTEEIQNEKEKIHNNQNNQYCEEKDKDSEKIEGKENEIISNSKNISSNSLNTEMTCTCKKYSKGNFKKKQRNKLFSYYDELPPIEDLHISVEEEEAKPIGTVLNIVEGRIVVIKTLPGLAAINLDSVLFLDKGKRALGRVDDVFGPIHEPHYVVKLKSAEDVKEKGVEKDLDVYFAPQTEHTTFVILGDLMNEKGSDASWKDNMEPPERYLDYSDDEEERQARRALRERKKQEIIQRKKENGEVIIIKEFESRKKKVRGDRPNPFSSTNSSYGSSHLHTRFAVPSHNNGTRNQFHRNRDNRYHADRRNNVRFGGPPNIRAGLDSPFSPCPSPISFMGDRPSFNSYARPSPSPSENFDFYRCTPSPPPPCFSPAGRPPPPLPYSPYHYNNQSFSPGMNTPPPPPSSPVPLNQYNSHMTQYSSNFPGNNPSYNRMMPPRPWSQNSVNTINNPPFPNYNNSQISENAYNLHSDFVPNTQNPPPMNSPVNPPPHPVTPSNQFNHAPPPLPSNHFNPLFPPMNNPRNNMFTPPLPPNTNNPPPPLNMNHQPMPQNMNNLPPPPPPSSPYSSTNNQIPYLSGHPPRPQFF